MTMPEYDAWVADPTPQTMADVVEALRPAINAEVQRFPGPKPLLRTKAKELTTQAVRTYDPSKGTQLRSWVVTSMQPLSRYSQQLRPVRTSEAVYRQAAEIERVREQLSDEMDREPSDRELSDAIGISVQRIRTVRRQSRAAISESVLEEQDAAEGVPSLPAVDQQERVSTVREMVYSSLNPRDQKIFRWKTGYGARAKISNQEIAKRLNVTPAFVSQRSREIAEQILDLAARQEL